MNVPRDLSGAELIRSLRRVGYETTRKKGSHVRLTTQRGGEHHVTVPMHSPLKVGTLSAVLREVADHLGLTREELLAELFE